MAWETRQQRLRDLLGQNRSYVFQLFAQFEVWPIPLDMTLDLCERHDLNFREIDRFELPKTRIGPFEFDGGHIGQRDSRLIRTECLYTSFPYSRLDAERFMEADTLVVKRLYLDARAKAIPELAYVSGTIGGKEGFNATFCYFAHE